MTYRHLVAIFAWAAVVILAVPTGVAAERDPDGSRMMARKYKVGSEERDRLSPPSDVVDWRYFRIKESRALTIVVGYESKGSTATISLTDATGESLGQATGVDGRAELTVELERGVYFFGVSASSGLSYSVKIQ